MTKSNIVGAKTVDFFINKKEGVPRSEVVRGLMEFVGISKRDAEKSIDRAVIFGKIKEKNGILKVKEIDY